MTEGISEAASKNKRGRPRLLSEEWEGCLRGIYPEVRSTRTLQNKHFTARAQRLLLGYERFKWLVDDAAKTFKPTLLEALGRIDDDDDLIAVAEFICDLKPATKVGERLIREMRLCERLKEPDAAELTEKIRLTIERYFVGKNRERFREVAKEALDTIERVVSWKLE